MEKTAEILKESKIEIPCLSTDCVLAETEKFEENLKQIENYLSVAKTVGTPYVRVLGEATPGPLEELMMKSF